MKSGIFYDLSPNLPRQAQMLHCSVQVDNRVRASDLRVHCVDETVNCQNLH